MKQDILFHYGRKRISQDLFLKFEDEASSGKIKFYLTDKGNLVIQ